MFPSAFGKEFQQHLLSRWGYEDNMVLLFFILVLKINLFLIISYMYTMHSSQMFPHIFSSLPSTSTNLPLSTKSLSYFLIFIHVFFFVCQRVQIGPLMWPWEWSHPLENKYHHWLAKSQKTADWKFNLYIHHAFHFTHSSADGCSDRFHLLAIISGATEHIRAQKYLCS